jgi:ornithine cyclodeaminase/alanine dehydrogenase-like protein (mu-crystallin family)
MATLLTEDDVRSVLTMADTVEAVEEAFRQYARGTVQVPLRIGVRIPAYNGFHGVMQAYVGGDIAASFAEEMNAATDIEVVAVDDPKAAVAGCDVVSTTTSSPTPVFEGKWLEEGTHVNAIGSHAPEVQELDSDTVARARVVVDSKEAVLAEAGDLIIPIKEGRFSADHIYAELGQLITGEKKGRSSDTEITLYKSVGLALQDSAAAVKAYELAKKKGIGTEVAL